VKHGLEELSILLLTKFFQKQKMMHRLLKKARKAGAKSAKENMGSIPENVPASTTHNNKCQKMLP
jgi:hypothetical protein